MGSFTGEKKGAVRWIEDNATLLTEISDRAWLYAEPSLLEYRTSKLLSEELRKAGFDVEMDSAGLDTAFVATYGQGSPVLCTFAEYEAVEGSSQMPVPYKHPVIRGKGGCYDMHHGLAAGVIGAAIAVKYVMQKHNIPGTLKVFGTPAEKISIGKNIMEREGLFENLDACIVWHPSIETSADWYLSILVRANNYTSHTFEGVSAYNAMPWAARNAFHALELMDVAVQFIKDAVVPNSHFPVMASIISKEYVDYAISSAPGIAKSNYISRALTRKDNELIQQKLFDCANAAALVFGVNVKNEVLTGCWEPIPNLAFANAVHKNIQVIGPPMFTEKDIEFGRLIQKEIGLAPTDTPFGSMEIPPPPGTRPPIMAGSSSDASIFSYKCPFVRVGVNYLGRFGLPDWSTAALSITNVAHQALLTAAKIMAASLIDLFRDPELLREAQVEQKQRTRDIKWYNPLPKDRPVPKCEPLPKEHYTSLIEAFGEGPKWEGFEPGLSRRMEKVTKEVLDELS
jgi:aminobenzoyl-glutamate utilization protein B